MKYLSILFLFIFLLLVACSKDKDDDDSKTPIASVDCTSVTYSGVISDLVTTKCNSTTCHGAGSSNGDFTAYDGIKPFADNGKLVNQVLDTQEMPRGSSLTSEQLGEFKCWLDDGAPNN